MLSVIEKRQMLSAFEEGKCCQPRVQNLKPLFQKLTSEADLHLYYRRKCVLEGKDVSDDISLHRVEKENENENENSDFNLTKVNTNFFHIKQLHYNTS